MDKGEVQFRAGMIRLLEIKDCDIRIMTLEQCRSAVDKGLHSGGAFSSIIPLVSLYYGGFIDVDVENPTRVGQDMFVLSKGHAVASMASVYADMGYFSRDVLKNSRSASSILNGHPGPILPGVHISTGPLGQGIAVAQGFAISGKSDPRFDVFCMTGDGELQEGIVWEPIMYSSHKKLDNLCVLVDKNCGQLDIVDKLIFPLENLDKKFESFGWRVLNVDATKYQPVVEALGIFRNSKRDGRPTVIICNTTKGFGSFNSFLNNHKVTMTDEVTAQEISSHQKLRNMKVMELLNLMEQNKKQAWGNQVNISLEEFASSINLKIESGSGIVPLVKPVICRRAQVRNKKVDYSPEKLPKLDMSKTYAANSINTMVMKEFAKDSKIISVDSDLSSTSGLEEGVRSVDQNRALNVGIAEANMMNLGEAFAALGNNVFVSTFCPFFDWKVMRRIAIGYQERIEDIASPTGWLNEGHGLDLTFVATAPNFETRTNGATHMGNDDITFFSSMGHLKIIDVSCPRQQISILRWIAEGNKGLIYLRIMRADSTVLYKDDYTFEFGKGYFPDIKTDPEVYIISSGRGVHEALSTADILKKDTIIASVVDMPSIDENLLLDLYDSGKLIVIAEQNNGYIWAAFNKLLIKKRQSVSTVNLLSVNTLDIDGNPQFIHSGTYNELLNMFELGPEKLAAKIKSHLI